MTRLSTVFYGICLMGFAIFFYLLPSDGLSDVPSPGSGTFCLSIRFPGPTAILEIVLGVDWLFGIFLVMTVVLICELPAPPLRIVSEWGTTWLWFGRGVLVRYAPVCFAVGLVTVCVTVGLTGPFSYTADSNTFRWDLFVKSLLEFEGHRIISFYSRSESDLHSCEVT